MSRKVVYCSACKTYYEERTGRLFELNDNDVTFEEKIICTRPAYDLASTINNNKTCGCRTPVRVPKGASKNIAKGWF